MCGDDDARASFSITECAAESHRLCGRRGTAVVLHLRPEWAAFLADDGVVRAIAQPLADRSAYTFRFWTDAEADQGVADGAEDVDDAATDSACDGAPDSDEGEEPAHAVADAASSATSPIDSYRVMSERARYIPLRLSFEERKLLRLAEVSIASCGLGRAILSRYVADP